MASWAAPQNDDTLLAQSSVIIYAQYQGESTIISDKGFQLNLGVLNPSIILKNDSKHTNVFFLQRPNPDLPLSSDMIFFKPGQTGLWFLNEVPGSTGIYQISHPSQFKQLPEDSDEISHWKQRLK